MHKKPPKGTVVVRKSKCAMCGEMVPVYEETMNDGRVVLVSNTTGCPGLKLPSVRIVRARG